METLRLYWRYTALSLRGQMQYRASFALLTLGHLLATGVEFFGIVFLFQRFGNIRGWELPEIALFYGVTNAAFALAEGLGRGFDTFPNLIKTGDFDRLLLRPRNTAFQIAAQELQLMRIGRLLQAVAVLIWALTHLAIAWTVAKIAILLGAIVGAACLFYGLFVLQATLAFWTVESLEIMNTVTYGGTETGQYPLTLYRPWFRRFFTFVVPLACVNYLPVGLILDRADSGQAPALWHGVAPLVGVGFLLLAFQIWKLGERRYRSTGS